MSKERLLDRFLRYVMIDTEADPFSGTVPSSNKQKDLSRLLVDELKDMGIPNVIMTEHGYVYAHIPTKGKSQAPGICFCAHVDTAPDCSGKDVKPRVIENYQGQVIRYPLDNSLELSPDTYPHISEKMGNTIITASGDTLLGGDDKAGVAIIMEAAQRLLENEPSSHGPITLLFTTDEEIGKGVDHVDMELVGAKFGYTLDGGPLGTMEDETFSADSATLRIRGISAHPGYAKGQMKNAIKIAGEILAELPKDHLCPEATEGKEGFIHPTHITGDLETAEISFLLRDFDTKKLDDHFLVLYTIAERIVKRFPGANFSFERKEQYRNMKEVLDLHPEVVDYAMIAMERAGISPKKGSIRGGTDGSRLSFMGLPCPNLFAGEQAIHSKMEWVALEDMEKAVDVLAHLINVWHEKST